LCLGSSHLVLDVAQVLRVLVDSANAGQFPEIPSVWHSFLQYSVREALVETTTLLDGQLAELVESVRTGFKIFPGVSFSDEGPFFFKARGC
jgi:hypothetical protein